MAKQEYTPPAVLLRNNVALDPKHLKETLAAGQIERNWYRDTPPFADTAAIRAAVKAGRLVKVAPAQHYAPIMRFRDPNLIDKYPPYLTPAAKRLLEEITVRWTRRMAAAGLDPQIRLALTSLVRTVDYQRQLIEAGKLAQPDSPHLRGEAFDIDASGYYLGDTPINARASQQQEIATAIEKIGGRPAGPKFGDYKLYQPRAHELLREVLEKMTAEGKLHYLDENPGTISACYHVCRNPEFSE